MVYRIASYFVPLVVTCSLVTLASWTLVGYVTDSEGLPVSDMEREAYTSVELTWQFAFRNSDVTNYIRTIS